ncbi:MAG: DUF4242 domain-containing protein [Bauldia sp.]
MPLYVIERTFADQVAATGESVRAISEINHAVGVHWLFSFLSADKRKTYCLYEADSAEAIMEAARRNGIPADLIVEVTDLNPAAILSSSGLPVPEIYGRKKLGL